MKGICLIVILLIVSLISRAQTYDEWFRQKKTQIQYLTQQIASLQLYAGYLGKGYKIAKTGFESIGNIKNGELNLHKAFISSLLKINPAIGKDFRIAAIIALQESISEDYRKCLNSSINGGMIAAEEITYVHSVFDNLLDNCEKEIDALITVSTNDQLQLSDDERLKRIEAIYQGMKDKQHFSISFCNQINALTINRLKAQEEINNTKQLFNLK